MLPSIHCILRLEADSACILVLGSVSRMYADKELDDLGQDRPLPPCTGGTT